jgi:translation initiation factor IF-1
MQGTGSTLLPDTRFLVTLDKGAEVTAYLPGKICRHRIRVLTGDNVTLEMSPCDLTKGRINVRHKDERPPPAFPRPRGTAKRTGCTARPFTDLLLSWCHPAARPAPSSVFARAACVTKENGGAVSTAVRSYSALKELTDAQRRSKRSRFITLAHAATKSSTNIFCPSDEAYTSATARSSAFEPNTRSTGVAVHLNAPLCRSRPS